MSVRSLFVVSLLGIGMAFVPMGCTSKQNSTKPRPQSESIRIGEVGTMTGTDASFGISNHNGVLLAIEEINSAGGINGHPLELITLDDQGKASEAVSAISKLIHQHHVSAVLGEVSSTISIAMAPVAQKAKVPLISPSSINSKVTEQGDYIFRTCFIDQFQSKVMAEFAFNHLHAKRVAILKDIKNDYSIDSAKIFAEQFKQKGGEIIIDQTYSSGDIDFKSQLTAIRSTKPDLILVPGYYTEVALIARQKKELGIDAPLLGGDGWDSPKLKEIGGSALSGSFFVSHFSVSDQEPLTQKFAQNYQQKYNVFPDGIAALGYDATLILADALKRKDNGDLRTALSSTQNFTGVTGKITINSQRNAVKPARVFKLTQDGKTELAATIQP